jgi:SAM-dependent methyltransferase
MRNRARDVPAERPDADPMRRFWDARADEDPYYFVDNSLAYGAPDTERFWASGEEAVRVFADWLGVEPGPADHVVEIGCGMGRITRALAARAERVTALDLSPRMLELAREHNSRLVNVTWLLGDGHSLAGVDDESADACFSFVVFQHIPDPEVTLGYVREMGRVLRPGGWAAFQVSNAPGIHRRSLVRRALARLRRGPGGQADPAWVGSAIELAALERVAVESGLALERVRGAETQYCLVLARRVNAHSRADSH